MLTFKEVLADHETGITISRIKINNADDTCLGVCTLLCLRLLRCYVFPVMLYGIETWTTEIMSKIPTEKISLVSNTTVLYGLEKQCEVMFTTKQRQLDYFGHVMRNHKYSLL